MDINYQYILQIAADALSIKYPLNYGILYWQGKDQILEAKATITLNGQIDAAEGEIYTISQSMMGAIKIPLLITRSRSATPYSQIIVPLVVDQQKVGLMAFWGLPIDRAASAEDRLLLTMVGAISQNFLNGLHEGKVVELDQTATAAQLKAETPDSDDFIEIEYDEAEEHSAPDSQPEAEMEDAAGIFDFEPRSIVEKEDDTPLQFSEEDLQTDLDDDDSEEDPRESDIGDLGISCDPTSEKGLELFLRYSRIGFISFDRECRIDPEFKLTNSSFFKVPLEKQTALELLFEWGDADNESSASFEKEPDYGMIKDLMSTVFDRVTDLDVLKELLPKEIGVKDKTFKMEYHYLKPSESASEDRILAVFYDVSREKEYLYQYKTEVERSNMIVKVALDIDGYYYYRNNTENALKVVSTELTKPADEVRLEVVLHQIQDILGGAEIYEINEITVMVEQIISTIEDLLYRTEPVTDREIEELKERVDLIRDVFDTLQKQYLENLVSDEQILDKAVYRVTQSKISRISDEMVENILKKQARNLSDVFEKNYRPFTRLKSLEEVTQKRLESIQEYLQTEIVESGTKELQKAMADLKKQPIGLVLKRYAIIAVNLGERQKKRVEVEIKGAEIEVPFQFLEPLLIGLVFVIRNSVEHGLEKMQERMDQDKSLEGNISIHAALDDNLLSIEISDDGKGIDVEKVRSVAIQNGVISSSEAESASDREILLLMFKKGFSTKKDARGAFGRGVGLSAVGNAVEELGGEVSLKTELNRGTTVAVSIPLPN